MTKVYECPHCGYNIDENDDYMEYTVGVIGDALPHIVCPNCNECIGCNKNLIPEYNTDEKI